ncbi:hypothetical protein B0T16DRAFT_181910 [Cercophora newfieldiana]|uniref:Uncharacterized protein n=1 Tax=Cercophora newfieldiana TaxID=92897 RepID=A0AA40CM07_9PEZI|nr:hypothetical protein B0T16DRAFT_181910 [Cercophora newfieldiana]
MRPLRSDSKQHPPPLITLPRHRSPLGHCSVMLSACVSQPLALITSLGALSTRRVATAMESSGG